MIKPNFHPVVASILLLGLAGCDHWATLPESAGFGPAPTLPPPHPTLIPTVQIAPGSLPEGTTVLRQLAGKSPGRKVRPVAGPPAGDGGGPPKGVAGKR